LENVKIKFTEEQAMKAQRAVRSIDLLLLFSALDEVGAAGQRHAPATLSPVK
jgi:hypothetical protein